MCKNDAVVVGVLFIVFGNGNWRDYGNGGSTVRVVSFRRRERMRISFGERIRGSSSLTTSREYSGIAVVDEVCLLTHSLNRLVYTRKHDSRDRYQPVSYQIISRSGDENAFASMVSTCKSQGVDVYVDVVMNHMAQGSGVGIAGTNYGGRSYLNYSADDMHHNDGDDSSNCVVNNYQDQHNVQYCDLEALPDLCTECPNVQNVLRSYLSKLKDLGVSGFRVDAAKHQNPPDLANVLQPFSDMTVLQEVIEGAGEAVKA